MRKARREEVRNRQGCEFLTQKVSAAVRELADIQVGMCGEYKATSHRGGSMSPRPSPKPKSTIRLPKLSRRSYDGVEEGVTTVERLEMKARAVMARLQHAKEEKWDLRLAALKEKNAWAAASKARDLEIDKLNEQGRELSQMGRLYPKNRPPDPMVEEVKMEREMAKSPSVRLVFPDYVKDPHLQSRERFSLTSLEQRRTMRNTH
jgi:hypothetical protein